MKVVLPDHIGDITLGQQQDGLKLEARTDLTKLEYTKRKIAIYTNLKYRQLAGVSMKDFDSLSDVIDKALALTPPFKNRFKMNDVEFGFIPNLDKMSTAEFADLSEYEKDPQQYHLLMAILFRPIRIKDAMKNYSIKEYKGTSEYGHAMKGMPLNIVNGALDFFFRLADELETSTRKSIKALRMKIAKNRWEAGFSKNGDGMIPSQK